MSSVNRLVEIYCCESIAGDLDKLLFAVECFVATPTESFEDSDENKNDKDRAMNDE